ncbi:unnamed protein product [Ceutorhynchus assimilis]|uniref:Uncharacterized protein n=1 Tax=Ceutorhynchus assimilis TaxID=467358 RepID=A0A9N9M9C5_9CUCU|nr:unnamed protein product [Ceutorhynchus assimilis]
MADKLTKAILKRTIALNRLKESFVIGRNASTDEAFKSSFLARANEIDGIYGDFQSAHNNIISSITEEEFKDHDILRISADSAYYGLRLDTDYEENQSNETSLLDVFSRGVRSVPELPHFYAQVPECILSDKHPSSPACSADIGDELIKLGSFREIWHMETSWLNHVHTILSDSIDDVDPNTSWSAFHAKKQRAFLKPTTSLNALPPLFHEKLTFPDMIKPG